ncbi:hypothetical protein SAMD00019534_076580, partial [Acytostelium subglobosum LB1]|uniref:hypothetical protein n=1 Tax=Acytostelium subglobosum LB1 TaxID=1410327 RepID=UPI000644B85B
MSKRANQKFKGAASSIRDGIGVYFGVLNENENQDPTQRNNNTNREEPYWMNEGFWERSANRRPPNDVEMSPLPDNHPPPPSYESHLNNTNNSITPGGGGQYQQPLSPPGSHLPIDVDPAMVQFYPPEMVDPDVDRGRPRGRGRGRAGHPSRMQHGAEDKSTSPQVALGPMDPSPKAGRRPAPPNQGVNAVNFKESEMLAPPPPQKYYPYFTIMVSLVDVAVLVWEIILNKGFESWKVNPWFGPSITTLLDAGAKYTTAILAGEWWRFFSPIFLHVGIFHLLMNMLTQVKIGMQLERTYGAHRIFPIYILCGVMGNLCSAIFLPNSVQAGASGAIFGFLGVLLTDLIRNWGQLASPYMNCCTLVFTIVLSFAVGLFLPGVDNFAHLGGFIMGVLSSLIFLPNLTTRKATGKRICQLVVAIPLTGGILFALFFLFYRNIQASTWCPICKYITCLQFLSWCKASG